MISLQKSPIYRYVAYRLEKLGEHEASLASLDAETRERLARAVAKKVMGQFLAFGAIFCLGLGLLISQAWRVSDESVLVRFYINLMLSANEVIQGDWGPGIIGKRGVILETFILLLPLFIPILMVSFGVMAFIARWQIKKVLTQLEKSDTP